MGTMTKRNLSLDECVCIVYGKRCMIEKTNIIIGPTMGASPLPVTLT
jgi:hypothetical protein